MGEREFTLTSEKPYDSKWQWKSLEEDSVRMWLNIKEKVLWNMDGNVVFDWEWELTLGVSETLDS